MELDHNGKPTGEKRSQKSVKLKPEAGASSLEKAHGHFDIIVVLFQGVDFAHIWPQGGLKICQSITETIIIGKVCKERKESKPWYL